MDLGQRFDRLHRLAYKHCRAAVGKASYETFDADHRLFCNYFIYGSIDLVPLDVRAALFVVASCSCCWLLLLLPLICSCAVRRATDARRAYGTSSNLYKVRILTIKTKYLPMNNKTNAAAYAYAPQELRSPLGQFRPIVLIESYSYSFVYYYLDYIGC